jgi:NADH dehydrogenase (ubiquinone) 1 beta subcomplex subunit 7
MNDADDGEASQEEMKANRVPLGYRDSCAHLLIPLNQCRLREFYLPWKCEDERYSIHSIDVNY